MAQYELTNLAREDLREIARYSLATWGIKQAERYQRLLENCLIQIAKGEISGRTFLGRRRDLLFTRCEHHFIFFVRRQPDRPLIIAIFHQKMELLSRIRRRLEN